MSEHNKQVVARFDEAVWSQGRLDAAQELLAPDLIDHHPMPFPGRQPGAAGLLQVVQMVRAGLPDLKRVVHAHVAEGDLVVTRFTDRGTHQAFLMGVPPTGREISVDGINVARVHDGRITELWHVEDLLGLMRQLGAIPG